MKLLATMEIGILRVFVRLLVVQLVCLSLVVFGQSEVSDPNELDFCVGRAKTAATAEVLSKLGGEIMGVHQTSHGFVYSELNIANQLVQWFRIGSVEARQDIQRNLLFPQRKHCKKEFCQYSKELMDLINVTMGDNFLYGNVLYKNKSKSGQRWDCGTVKDVDFDGNRDSVSSQINQDYQNILQTQGVRCLQHFLNPQTDIFLLSSSGVKPTLFGDMKSYKFPKQFKDLDGLHKHVTWVGMQGNILTRTFTLLPLLEKDSVTCEMTIVRTEVNDGKQYMLYFQMKFEKIKNVHIKIECIQKVLSNIKQYVRVTIDMRQGSTNLEFDQHNYLLLPAISFQTDLNLKTIMQTHIPKLFETGQLKNFYNRKDTLYEMRMCEYFTNVGKDCEEGTLPSENEMTYIDEPFIFTLVDKQTGILLKTGTYLRPEVNKTQ